MSRMLRAARASGPLGPTRIAAESPEVRDEGPPAGFEPGASGLRAGEGTNLRRRLWHGLRALPEPAEVEAASVARPWRSEAMTPWTIAFSRGASGCRRRYGRAGRARAPVALPPSGDQ